MKNWLLFLVSLLVFSPVYAQTADSLQIVRRFDFEIKKTAAPAGLQVLGLVSLKKRDLAVKNGSINTGSKALLGFHNHLEDYAQFAPFAGVYGLEFLGMTPKTDWQNRTAILLKGQLLNLGLVYILKDSFKTVRPDGNAHSFPSGHTANAFAGATMLAIEYGDQYHWVPYAAYGVATGVGVLRMVHKKHYISDVLFGAGLGILSMKLAYWTHQYTWNRKKSTKNPFENIIPAEQGSN